VRAIPITAGLRAPATLARDSQLTELIADLSRDLGSTVRIEGDRVAIR
jgi:hypothetical protein